MYHTGKRSEYEIGYILKCEFHRKNTCRRKNEKQSRQIDYTNLVNVNYNNYTNLTLGSGNVDQR